MTPDKKIKFVSIIFAGIALYNLITEFGMLTFMFSGQGIWDFSMVMYFLPLIWIPLSVVFFWMRKKAGWILLSMYLCYSTVNTFASIILFWNTTPLDNTNFDSLFPVTSPVIYLMTLIFFIGTLWLISKQDLREKYNIRQNTMIGTIGITTIISAFILFQ